MAPKTQPAWEIYNEEMSRFNHGHALWEPAPTESYNRISVGDVGFIRWGQFHLLFSAGCPLGERQPGIDVPLTFEKLHVGSTRSRQPLTSGCIHTNTVRAIEAGVGASVSMALPVGPGASFSFKLTGKRGAALMTRYQAYREDTLKKSAFERYIKKHYDSWVTFARDQDYGDDVKPVLVSGFDRTKDFAMATYSNDDASFESDLSISVPMLASASASFYVTESTSGLTHTNHGPQQCVPPSSAQILDTSLEPTSAGAVSDDYNQCVFVRYYTIRKRMGLFPKVIRAAAGPHDLGPGDNHDDTFPELMTQQDPTSDHEGDPTSDDEEGDLTSEDGHSDLDIVVHNAPDDEGYDEFDVIADYVFQNSNATSVLMHHQDLAGIRVAEDARSEGISAILTKSRPHVAVDESGVGRIVCGGDPSQDLVDPTATPTFPLTNQDQPEAPLQEPKEHAEPPSPQMKCVFPSDQREPPLQELKERTGPSNPQMKDDGEGKREREGRSISEKTPDRSIPPTLKQLTGHTLTTHERITLITTIFSDHDHVEVVGSLLRDDAQNVIDAIDEVLDDLEPQVHERCLRFLYSICGHEALLPRSLVIPLFDNLARGPLPSGGFSDVWKGRYNGREVAAKVLQVRTTSDIEEMRKRFCEEVVAWKALRHPNVLPLLGVTMAEFQFVMVSDWMVNGTINEFLKANVDADRLELLRDITRGLIYMHDQGIVHGNLTGSNVLVDNNGHACLTGFSLLMMASDGLTGTFSFREGGTIRYMSPERLNPEKFGLQERRPTKESDCYALGMVVYEVLSGRRPFFTTDGIFQVMWKIMEGEHPERPQGEKGKPFTDDIWGTLELCWKPQPRDRISTGAVLLRLEGHPPLLRPSSNVDEDAETDSDGQRESGSDDYSDLFDRLHADSELPTAHGDKKPLLSQRTANPEEGLLERIRIFKIATKSSAGFNKLGDSPA